MNVVLSGRNMNKLKKAEEEVKKVSKVQTKLLKIDFNESTDIDFYQSVVEQVADIDVSILINNAGVMYCKPFPNSTYEELKDIFETNMYGYAILTKLFTDVFLKREKRSAIINIASVAGMSPAPFLAHYAASKAYARSFTKAIVPELSHKIDVLCHSPAYVETNMTLYYKR